MRIDLHPEARAEIRSAAIWYEEHRERLGEKFVEAVGASLERIQERSAAFPRWPGTEGSPVPIRRASLQRFPYAIAFEDHGRRALVLAVAHQRRRPLYWLTRVDPPSA